MVSNLISFENDILFSFLFLVEEDFDELQEVYSGIVDREKKDNNLFLYFRIFFFLREFLMTSTPDNNSLSSEQDINQFLVFSVGRDLILNLLFNPKSIVRLLIKKKRILTFIYIYIWEQLMSSASEHWTCCDVNTCPRLDTCLYPNESSNQ